jgi:hypothetical protein
MIVHRRKVSHLSKIAVYLLDVKDAKSVSRQKKSAIPSVSPMEEIKTKRKRRIDRQL